ncbi:Abi-alpha family protein [Desulfopila aestuarii]|nr:Abi-alpha family protein [Desulfopila aestuarii]
MLEEEAKAIQEVSKFGVKALDNADKLGGFLSKVFGTVPEDVVGVIGGDWLRHARIRNAAGLAKRTEEILRERGIENQTEPMSPSVAIPLLEAAQDETRKELHEWWCRLLANGMDPDRSHLVRVSIIETIKRLDPLDALVLEKLCEKADAEYSTTFMITKDIGGALAVHQNEFELSIGNLTRLSCAIRTPLTNDKSITHAVCIDRLGWEVIRSTRL